MCDVLSMEGLEAAAAGGDASRAACLRLIDHCWPPGEPFPPMMPWIGAIATRGGLCRAIRAEALPAREASGVGETDDEAGREAILTAVAKLLGAPAGLPGYELEYSRPCKGRCSPT